MASNNQNSWLGNLGIGFGSSVISVPEQHSGLSPEMNQFEQPDRLSAGSNTLKRNPKMELSKHDLLKLVTYFEGEIQARDVVIAALKSEKLKQVVNVGRYRPAVIADPYTALLRDSVADGPTAKPPISEKDMAAAAAQQIQALEHLALQQRQAHQHMMNILKDSEIKHKKVIQELEEEKCKHEHDTAQGDDITYGLEMERTRLRQELEMERTARKKLEKEIKRQLEIADEEKARQKQIVLLLLTERKKIIVKYIEERKRSEDLAQLLAEEKSRIDTMAEGLEEESKKSLQMEAELESQLQIFESEKKNLKQQLTAKEVRCKELEADLQMLKAEYDAYRSRTNVPCDSSTPLISSVAKMIQPTATVSSVPVSGPTTGIAQSVPPGQALRQTCLAPTPLINVPKVSPPLSTGQGTSPTVGAKPSQKLTQFSTQHTNLQTLPKKSAMLGRGAPPPIPPNKPVIPTKQSTSRRPDSAESAKKLPKGPMGSSQASASSEGGRSGDGIEMIGQELADFQQMLVTMATSSNP